ncbi:hypothetical protein CA262_11130 [Sphingobium sp. GW456-12-10-14-TSB1]|uniref:Uncharacterized protein n=1 Tax=Sphingobium xenophagum TaxID=121428 RepID=A0A249MPP8_SPHXE|nr:hypothetical protein CJD35_01830 [Sphingobium xenophagum]OUC55347.1 hypothetical protein CA262_11130 [Sphingobium sp. GW456-12-10-14-TSB1]
MRDAHRRAFFFALISFCTSDIRVREETILPLQGRWLAGGQTEGCGAIDRATPLHHRYAAVPLPLQGRIIAVLGLQSA